MLPYLLASLPSLQPEGSPPMAVAALAAEVRRLLPEADAGVVFPPEGAPAVHEVARRYASWDTQLRNAVARRRVRARGDAAPLAARPHEGYRVDIDAAVEAAFDAPDPGARERALDALRWRLLDELAALDRWGVAALFAYARQLELLERRAALDPEAGRARVARFLSRTEVRHA